MRRILDHDPRRQGGAGAAVPPTPLTPAPSDSVRLRHDVLQLLRTVFSAPGNPFVQDKATTGEYAALNGGLPRRLPAVQGLGGRASLPKLSHRPVVWRPAPTPTPQHATHVSLPQSLASADFYIQFHFIQFLKLYHNPQRDHQALNLCKKHMEVGAAGLLPPWLWLLLSFILRPPFFWPHATACCI